MCFSNNELQDWLIFDFLLSLTQFWLLSVCFFLKLSLISNIIEALYLYKFFAKLQGKRVCFLHLLVFALKESCSVPIIMPRIPLFASLHANWLHASSSKLSFFFVQLHHKFLLCTWSSKLSMIIGPTCFSNIWVHTQWMTHKFDHCVQEQSKCARHSFDMLSYLVCQNKSKNCISCGFFRLPHSHNYEGFPNLSGPWVQQTPTKFFRFHLWKFLCSVWSQAVCRYFVQFTVCFIILVISMRCCFCPTLTMADCPLKRSRTAEISVDDVLHYACIIMNNDLLEDWAPAKEDQS